ncbi:MAG: hypothetical protein KZQ58_07700 [gamma proteobacterium symbiont of Bathyaustriella thionipta]|nr:hypothetical protein [gamma proteobacterium symbiont of Bathyaustriella thionipta]
MSRKSFFMGLSLAVIAGTGFVGGSINIHSSGWMSFNQAEASAYRRSVRRTARRTSRRTAARHSYAGDAYYGGAAVAGAVAVTAIAVGTIVATLPPSCRTIDVDGIRYHECEGNYYVPSGNQWVSVAAP